MASSFRHRVEQNLARSPQRLGSVGVGPAIGCLLPEEGRDLHLRSTIAGADRSD